MSAECDFIIVTASQTARTLYLLGSLCTCAQPTIIRLLCMFFMDFSSFSVSNMNGKYNDTVTIHRYVKPTTTC